MALIKIGWSMVAVVVSRKRVWELWIVSVLDTNPSSDVGVVVFLRDV